VRTGALLLAAIGLCAGTPMPRAGERIPFEKDMREVCGIRWLDRSAQIQCESGWDPAAKSFDGGEGLGQATHIWPEYIRRGWVPVGSSPFEVRPAIMGCHRYMNYLEPLAGGWIPGCGAYNAGLGNIRKAQMLAEQLGYEGPDGWLVTLPQVTKKNAHYTINYIRNIRYWRKHYGSVYGEK